MIGVKIKKQEQGFTLAELLVAMSIFVVFVVVLVGIFVRLLKTYRYLDELILVNNSSGYVLEQLIREIRTGFDFCQNITTENPQPCQRDNQSFLTFTNNDLESVNYSLVNGELLRNGIALNSLETKVEDLKFFVTQENNYCFPWRVTVLMTVGPKNSEVKQKVSLQTTISSRVLPVEVPGVSFKVRDNCLK